VKIIAYKLNEYAKIEKADLTRNWMDFSSSKFAYGCLPLIIANEMGWNIICQTSFKAIWNGSMDKDSITIQFLDEKDPNNSQVDSHFGHGVITFHPGFLFSTEVGHNLYVKGVPNYLKDAIQPLEGVVETDWLPFTFTMNWKFTRSNTWVEFLKGEPIARILPYPRHYVEGFNPSIMHISTNEQLGLDYKDWTNDRNAHQAGLQNGTKTGMEKNYFKGVNKRLEKVEYHQKKLVLKDFNDNDQTTKVDI
jgi:hypothetical protein